MIRIPRWIRGVVWLIAAIGFVAATFIIVRNNPELLRDVRVAPLAAAFALVPIAVALNVVEYRLSARYLALQVTWRKALEVTVLGTAANMLPLPGATVVRAAGLVGEGARPGRSATVTLTFAFSWVATSCLYSGVALLLAEERDYGLALVGVGGVALSSFLLISIVRFKQPVHMPLAALLVKLAVVVVEAIQIYLCFAAIRSPVSFIAASAIQVSAIAGSALAIVPAGLGVREGVGSLVADLMGLGRGRAFVAVALNRVLSMIFMVPLALALAARKK